MRVEDYCDTVGGALRLRRPLQHYAHREIITDHPEMKRQLLMLERAGRSNIPLMILGEKGSEKELIAQYAHGVSSRGRGPLIKMSCAYLSEKRAHRELFGTSGRREPGLLRQSVGGTLYIENLDLMPHPLQNELMNHIYCTEGKPGDIRLMACLWDRNRESSVSGLIEPMIHYFNAMLFDILPLRERPEDILLLTFQQLSRFRQEYRIERTLSPQVMTAMLSYSWPGNTRQLTQTIERMAFLNDETQISAVSLLEKCMSVHDRLRHTHAEGPPQPRLRPLKLLVQDYEIMIINQYVEQYGSIRKAAAALNSSPATLSRKITEYNKTSKKDNE